MAPTDDGLAALTRHDLEGAAAQVLREIVARPGLTRRGLKRRLQDELEPAEIDRRIRWPGARRPRRLDRPGDGRGQGPGPYAGPGRRGRVRAEGHADEGGARVAGRRPARPGGAPGRARRRGPGLDRPPGGARSPGVGRAGGAGRAAGRESAWGRPGPRRSTTTSRPRSLRSPPPTPPAPGCCSGSPGPARPRCSSAPRATSSIRGSRCWSWSRRLG